MNRYPEPTRVPERPYDAEVAWLACAVVIVCLALGFLVPHAPWQAVLAILIAGGLGAILGVNNLMLELGNQGFCFKRGYDEEGRRCWKIGTKSGGGVIWL